MKQDSIRARLGRALEKHAKSSDQAIWGTLSETLLSSRKNRPEVNVTTISRHSKDGSKVVIPGKVLGAGSIDHKVTVAAYSFSSSAKSKILEAGGACVGLLDFMEQSKNVKDVIVLG